MFNAANRSAAYRFVTLVDVVYEERVRLICAAEAGPLDLFRRIVTQGEYAKSEKCARAGLERGAPPTVVSEAAPVRGDCGGL